LSRLGQAIAWNRLGLWLSRATRALRGDAAVQGFSVWIMLRKGLEGVAHGLVPVLLIAVAGFFSDSSSITAALQHAGYSPTLIAILVPVSVGITKMLTNRLKNRPAPAEPAPPVDISGWRDR
jgi:hypothetical protein